MKFLAGITGALSGKLGGLVASHNRSGAYFRTLTIPTNPDTARQQAVRNDFQTLAELWNNTLSQAERDEWNLYAANITVKDKVGQDIYLTGFNHYMRTNCIALPAGAPRIDAAPTIFTLADTDPDMAGTVDDSAQEISVAFDDALAWCSEDDAIMQIALSKPQNGGRAFIQPQFRVAGFIAGDSGAPITSPQVLSTPWPVTEGQAVMVQARILRADGRLSPPFRHTSSVVA